MKKYLIIIIILIPLSLSGCFFKRSNNGQPTVFQPEVELTEYQSQDLNGFWFSASYPANWELTEIATDNFGDFKDTIKFSGAEEVIQVNLIEPDDYLEDLERYNIIDEMQTEVNGFLAHKLYGSSLTSDGYNFEVIYIDNVKYIIVLRTNQPDSINFINFLTYFNFEKIYEPKDYTVDLTLYFDENVLNRESCEMNLPRTVTVNRPLEDLQLIPLTMRLLIQLSQYEELKNHNLISSIPVTTELLSYGYQDNKVIVNFNQELNKGGGSCTMQARRNQIEQTLLSLNEISSLDIQAIEIQVEGDSETALQP